jgi:hypothetical protein
MRMYLRVAVPRGYWAVLLFHLAFGACALHAQGEIDLLNIRQGSGDGPGKGPGGAPVPVSTSGRSGSAGSALAALDPSSPPPASDPTPPPPAQPVVPAAAPAPAAPPAPAAGPESRYPDLYPLVLPAHVTDEGDARTAARKILRDAVLMGRAARKNAGEAVADLFAPITVPFSDTDKADYKRGRAILEGVEKGTAKLPAYGEEVMADLNSRIQALKAKPKATR